MAIVFPREFPTGIYLRTLSFRMVQPVKVSRLASGATDAVGQPSSYWVGSWQTNFLKNAQIGEMSAWINSMKGGSLKFMARDPQRCATYLHDDFSSFTLNGSAFDGSTVVAAIPDLNQISMPLPAGFNVAVGDWFQIVSGVWHTLHEVEETVSVGVEGNYTLTFNPPLPVGVYAVGAVVSFDSPGLPMIFSSVSEPENSAATKRFSFSGRSS